MSVVTLFQGLSCLLVVSIASAQASAQTVKTPVSVVDATGYRVALDGAPRRIVSLIPSNTELVYAVGAGAALVGVTNYCTYPPEAIKLPKVGDLLSVSAERIVAMNPDLVVATKDNPMEVIDGLRALHIPVFVDDPQTVEQVIDSIRKFGELTGHQATADSLASDIHRRLVSVEKRIASVSAANRTTIFVGSPLNTEHWTPGPGTFTTDVIWWAGGRNVADDLRPRTWGVYSVEQIVAKNPQALVTAAEPDAAPDATRQRLLKQAATTTGWKELRAIREGRVIVLPADWLFRPGPRLILGVEALAKALYPSLINP